MARRSLKPQLNQIRAWVKQGRTDAWIAHQLEVTVTELRAFRNQHELKPDEDAAAPKEVELRDEIEAEVQAATAEETAEAEEPEVDEEDAEAEPEVDEGPSEAEEPAAEDGGGEGTRTRRRRRRGKRGGRGRRRELEATFDHGERDGYGLWLDAGVKDNPVYTEHWAGKRAVSVRIEPDQIVIRRAGETGNGSDSD
jgi:hypothetical protein